MRKLAIIFCAVLMAGVMALCAGCGATGVGATGSSSASGTASVAASGVLADGEYDIDVSLEGGSGRASIESPAKLVVVNGKMTLTVVWSSSNYDLMVVDGVEYKPVNTEGNSTFEIPVTSIDEDLPFQAETTAMSTPHMIDYVLKFEAGEEFEAAATVQVANFHNADLGNGWQPADSMKLQYAKCFTVDYYDG
ncbi:MAG: hypothetical protein IIZ12_04735, partial [Eggerthellaceae bacterium]|nr:hypothetical protein [Eggerthellaceae bacterium]